MNRTLLLIASIAWVLNTDAIPLRGFNTNAYLYNFPGQRFNQSYVQAVNELQPEILRFPGGTIANKYHFYQTGYGQGSAYDQKARQNYIVEFVRLLKSLEKEPVVIYVLNMFEHFYQPKQSDWELIVENLSALIYLKRCGVKVVAVELGNEFYLAPVIRGWDIKMPEKWIRRFTTEPIDEWWPDNYKKYHRLGKLYHQAIKKIDPNIQTGIPMGSIMNKNHKRWNAFAGQMHFSDAYIQHWYGQLKNLNDEAQARNEFLNFRDKVSKNIQQLQEEHHKDIWVTEWNGIDFGHKNDRNMHWKQSPLHIECNVSMQQLFDSLGVKISIYHRISSGKEGDSYNLMNVDRGFIIRNPTFHQFTLPPFRN
jgi:hypothetical protein